MTKYQSRLLDPAKRAKILEKIKSLHGLKPTSLVFEVDGKRHSAADCTGVNLDLAASDDQIVFQAPGDGAPRYYDLADIELIKRLRTRKYLIKIKTGANSAQATV